MRHPCFQQPDSILEKLRRFHHDHQTSLEHVMEAMKQGRRRRKSPRPAGIRRFPKCSRNRVRAETVCR
jgi:hypothetical protein